MIRRRAVALAIATAAVAVAIADAGASRALVAAHRGGALLWPENSLLAFERAIALGTDLLETDVHLTADGEVILLHDPTLDRTTTGSGRARDLGGAARAALRLRAADGSPTTEPVPLLAELLQRLRSWRAELLLEIKLDADRQRYPGIEEKVLDLLRQRALAARTVVMSFDEETLRRVRALDGGVRTALLVSRRRGAGVPPDDIVRWARAVGATHLGVDHQVLDAGVSAAARGAGLRVAAWTVNDEAAIRRALDHGAEIVITDRPDLALGILGRPPREVR